MGSGFRVDRDVEMPMRDGVVLRGDVWRPGDGVACPALVTRTPYQKELLSSDHLLRVPLAVAAGYVVVVQDVRGRHASDGEWFGLDERTWANERRDSFDTVEWVAAQPWCDGGVAVWGSSYLGAMAFLAGQERPPHLKAIAPATMGSRSTDHLDTGGAFRLHLWTVFNLAQRGEVGAVPQARRSVLQRDPGLLTDFLPLRDSPDVDAVGDIFGGRGSTLPDFELDRVGVPALLVGGWYDFYVGQTVRQYQRLRARSGSHRLVIGPWAHGGTAGGDVDFGPEALPAARVQPAHLGFFDRHLKGTGVDLAPVQYFLMRAGEWREASDWPPPEVTTMSLFLRGEGRLTREPAPGDEPPDRYRYDPLDPVRTHGGRIAGPGPAGPLEQGWLSRRPDVLTYTGDVLDQRLDIVGAVTARLYAATTAVDTDFVVRLVDVDPDGRAVLICAGLGRVSRMPAGQYVVDLGPTAWRLQPGHRLRVLVCSSDFPHLDRNMNTGNALGTDERAVIAEQTIFHDPDRPTRLELSVLPPEQD